MKTTSLLLSTVCVSALVLSGCESNDSSNEIGDFSRNLTLDLSDSSAQEIMDDILTMDMGTQSSLTFAQGDSDLSVVASRSLNSSAPQLIRSMLRTSVNSSESTGCDSGSMQASINGDIADDETSGDVTVKFSADACRFSEDGDGYSFDFQLDGSLTNSIVWEITSGDFSALDSSSTGAFEILGAGDGESSGHSWSYGFLYDLSNVDDSLSLNTSTDQFEVDANYDLYIEFYYIYDGESEHVGGSMSVETISSILYDNPGIDGELDYPVGGTVEVTVGSVVATVVYDSGSYTVTVGGVSNTYYYEDAGDF